MLASTVSTAQASIQPSRTAPYSQEPRAQRHVHGGLHHHLCFRPLVVRPGASRSRGGPCGSRCGTVAAEAADKMKLVLVVAVALVNSEGEVLLAQRPVGKNMAGLWELPGGKVEEGESPEEALARELREELGIRCDPRHFAPLTFASHAYLDSAFHLLMPVFGCSRWEGEPQGLEGQAVAWVPEAALLQYEMPPADEPLLPAVRRLMKDRSLGGV